MAVNKVVYGSRTLVDLTQDTVASDKLVRGYTAHDKAGNAITGSLKIQVYRTGNGEPSSSLGEEGDLYLDLG